MIKKEEIIVGTKEEIIEYYKDVKQLQPVTFKIGDKFEMKDYPMDKQINDIDAQKIGMGMIFYVEVTELEPIQKITFDKNFVYIRKPIPANFPNDSLDIKK